MSDRCHVAGYTTITSSSGVFCLDHLIVAVDIAGQQTIEELLGWYGDPQPPFAPRCQQMHKIVQAIQRKQNQMAEARP